MKFTLRLTDSKISSVAEFKDADSLVICLEFAELHSSMDDNHELQNVTEGMTLEFHLPFCCCLKKWCHHTP